DASQAGYGFRPAHRLHKTDEFSSVFAFRRSVRGRYFSLLYRPNGGDSARLGLVVAKKLARRAVLRNLVKRIARDVFRKSRSNLPCHDLVIRLAAPVTDVSRAALREDIEALLRRLPR
ncbi:MAG: ribonuclease P protein component, partial [Zoogloea sp.]|nr:ribonuclease P protein component [Zoogloea sp.]